MITGTNNDTQVFEITTHARSFTVYLRIGGGGGGACSLLVYFTYRVFTDVCHSIHNRPHGYLFTAHPCYSVVCTYPTAMLSCFIYMHFSAKLIPNNRSSVSPSGVGVSVENPGCVPEVRSCSIKGDFVFYGTMHN